MPPGQTYHGIVALATRLKRAVFDRFRMLRRAGSPAAMHSTNTWRAQQARRSVDSALVIAGDSDRASGPFESSLGLLETGLFSDMASRTGSGRLPEGHRR